MKKVQENEEVSLLLAEKIREGKPLLSGRMGFTELAVSRIYDLHRIDAYRKIMHNLSAWCGFFPEDTRLGRKFTARMKDCMRKTDVYACNRQPMEGFYRSFYLPKDSIVSKDLGLYDIFALKNPWTPALKGKRVLVVTSFPDSVKHQYARREEIYPGTEILPEFADLQVYKPLITIGDMRDERFGTWFEGLEFMNNEIRALDFDIALIAAGAYGYPLAAAVKESGRQAVCMGGVLQILFGILGRRWDGSRFGGIDHMPESLKRYYNESWIYPLEERPPAADGVEYGPYWK
ncbi:MAG: hypothetical protein IK115_11180 [Lachnospiraceae bacterium]|nr:hypothetical protein [Lachnospiraceae bacterium]